MGVPEIYFHNLLFYIGYYLEGDILTAIFSACGTKVADYDSWKITP